MSLLNQIKFPFLLPFSYKAGSIPLSCTLVDKTKIILETSSKPALKLEKYNITQNSITKPKGDYRKFNLNISFQPLILGSSRSRNSDLKSFLSSNMMESRIDKLKVPAPILIQPPKLSGDY